MFGNVTHHLHSSSVVVYTEWQKVLMVISLTLLSLFTILGNATTIYIYKTTRGLRKRKNYFILSLAAADLSIGLVSVNFFTVLLVVGHWPLGPVVCYIWVTVDFWSIGVSNFTLVAIALDRLVSVCSPMKHRWLHLQRAYVHSVIVAVWILAFLNWCPFVFMYTDVGENTCHLAFHENNVPLTIVCAIFGYYAPVTVLCTSYFFISYKMTRRCHEMYIVYPPASERQLQGQPQQQQQQQKQCKQQENKRIHKRPESCVVSTSTRCRYIKANRRGVRFLFFISFVFIISWMPYNLLIIVLSARGTQASQHLWNFCYIFGWISSALNPICYVLGNGHFREHFMKVVKNYKKKKNTLKVWREETRFDTASEHHPIYELESVDDSRSRFRSLGSQKSSQRKQQEREKLKQQRRQQLQQQQQQQLDEEKNRQQEYIMQSNEQENLLSTTTATEIGDNEYLR